MRGSLGFGFSGDVSIIRFTADAVYRFDLAGDITPYAGGGLRFFSASTDVAGYRISGSEIGIGLLGGAEYPLSEELDLFAELDLDFVRITYPNLIAGVNYHF